MHSTFLLPALLAAGTLAGPMLNQRRAFDNIKHSHDHMSFHQHEARDEDTPAEQLMNKLLSLGATDPVAAGGSGTPGSQPATPAQPAQPNQVVNVVVVTEVVGPDGKPLSSSSSSTPSPTPTPPAPVVQVVPQNKIEVPVVNQGPASVAPPPSSAPVVQQTPPSPSPVANTQPSPVSNALNGMPSAPLEFVEDLDADSPVYKALVLLHHNIHRANHSLAPLAWNDTLFDYAKQSAQSCVYEHTHPTPPYGQNIAAGNAPGNVSADITNGFYNGEIESFVAALGGSYGGNSPDMRLFEEWGHVTQMLWKDTTSVACYTAKCYPGNQDPQQCGPNGPYLQNTKCGYGGTRAYNLVCNYYPPGNYPNEYSAVPASVNLLDFVEMTGNGVIGLPKSW